MFIIHRENNSYTAGFNTERFPSDPEKDLEARTYTLNCDGLEGDMLYLTDRDYDLSAGHNFLEVKIFGSGVWGTVGYTYQINKDWVNM